MSKIVDQYLLCRSIDKEFDSLQKQILDIVEIVAPIDRWESIRSKILRLTNNARRAICSNIMEEHNYDEVIKLQERKR